MQNGTGKKRKYPYAACHLGGYVKFFGDDEGRREKTRALLQARPYLKRLLTVLAGPAMNFLLAFVLAVTFLCAFTETRIVVVADVLSRVRPHRRQALHAGR